MEHIMNEEWRKITPDYEVSNLGRVRSLKWRKRGGHKLGVPYILKAQFGRSNPYPRVFLGKRNFPIHVLVCFAWHGPKPTRAHVVRHLHGNPQNNTPANLCWGTQSENALDEVRLGRDHGSRIRALMAENAELKRKLGLT